MSNNRERMSNSDEAAREISLEKENTEGAAITKDLTVPNRRESFGRGILKNFAKKDENITVALPLRDIHHTGRLSLDGKAYRRRVSFAPEVTLHKIDLIPQPRSPELRQPRRRETIAFAPHTPRNLSPLPSESNSQEFEAEEIMYDSSDVEMDDATDVYSSPRKAGPSFKIHEDDQHDDYTGTIDMSITKHALNGNMTIGDEEDTMDLTKPLGNIQLLHPSLSRQPEDNLPSPTQESIQMSLQTENSSQDSINSQSQRPFGSIKSLFGDDEDAPEEDEEVDMELTQSGLHQLTSSVAEPIVDSSQPVVSEYSIPNEDDSAHEETMELATFTEVSMDRETIQNTIQNRVLLDTPERDITVDVTMDQTQAYGAIMENNDMDVTMEQTRAFGAIVKNNEMDHTTDEVTMDLTQNHTHSSTSKISLRNTTPLKANRSHTSEAGSPMSSKRKKRQESEVTTNDLRARINMLTPKKKRIRLSVDKTSLPPPSLVVLEQSQMAEPIISSQASISNELKSSFTPLRSSNNGVRKSVMNSGKVEFVLTQKIPLAPSHEQDELDDNQQEYVPVSLTQFLNDLSIEFFDDLNINEDFTVEFKTLPHTKTVTPLDYAIARNTKIPWLELYSFSCDELQKNMKELNGFFDDLDAEFAVENPRLVRDYYESTSFVQQKKMSDALIRMKQYSDYESEKAWSTWREKLFDELQIRLKKNFDTLQVDSKSLESGKEKITEINEQLDAENAALDAEIERLLQEKKASDSPDLDTLIDLRGELLSELHVLKAEEEAVSLLRKEDSELSEQIIDTTALENEILDMEMYVKRQSQDPMVRFNNELKKFEILEQISGLRLESLKGSIISICPIDSGIKVHFDLLQQAVTSVELPQKISMMKRVFLEKYIAENASLDPALLINGMETLSRGLSAFETDLFGIGLLCPSKIDITDAITVELVQFDRKLKYKAMIRMTFDESSILSGLLPHHIETKLVYGPKKLTEETILQGLKSKSGKSCFIHNISDLRLTRD